MPRLACAATLLALLVAGCGGGTETVTETQTRATPTTAPTTATQQQPAPTQTTSAPQGPPTVPAGNHGPHYFETPSHNIGCYISRHDARCDIRERSWTPPPEPNSCRKIGLDYGQGIVVGPNRAEFVCAGDTTLGGPGLLGYGHTAQRGSILCLSRTAGITCRNTANGHGFFLSRASYRIF